MIVPMKKVTCLIFDKEKDLFLQDLQKLGVIHIIEEDLSVNNELTELEDQNIRLVKDISLLEKYWDKDVNQESFCDEIQERLNRIEGLDGQLEKAEQKLQQLKKDEQELLPWGDYTEASFQKLEEMGIKLHFYILSEKKYKELELAEYTSEIINRIGTNVYFVILENNKKIELNIEEVKLPQQYLNVVQTEIVKQEKLISECQTHLQDEAKYIKCLKTRSVELENKITYQKALLSMNREAEGAVQVLKGWLPKTEQAEAENYFASQSVVYYLEDPAEEDTIPVLLKNNPFSRLFEPITRFFALPDYFELDPTPFLAPFFAFFFGLCLGDLGYGIIVLIASLAGYFAVPKSAKSFLLLGVILGMVTMINGVLLNTCFGNNIFTVQGTGAGFFSYSSKLAILSPYVKGSQLMYPAIAFSLVIGVVQVLVGMLLQSINKIRQNGWLHGIQPFCYMVTTLGVVSWLASTNFLDLGTYELYDYQIGNFLKSIHTKLYAGALPFAGMKLEYNYLEIVGLGVLIFFNNVDTKLFTRPLRFLYVLYNYITGLMSDGLSYLRLFALGLAGGLLGNAFNQIAFMFIKTPDGSLNFQSAGIIGTILILVVGHSLNLILAAISSFAHPLRLIFVEFYNNLDFKWGGMPFKYFIKKEN